MTPSGESVMRAICDQTRLEAPTTADGEKLHLDLWWPDYPEPVVVLTSSKHIAWGASLEPDGARALAVELERAAEACERARAAMAVAA